MTKSTKQVAKLSKPTFMFTCLDSPETAPLRLKHLEGHLTHIETHNDAYRVAGPIRDQLDGDIIGSVFLIAAETELEARAFMAGDPYMASDMYASVTVYQMVPACGSWMGSVIWNRDTLIKTHPN